MQTESDRLVGWSSVVLAAGLAGPLLLGPLEAGEPAHWMALAALWAIAHAALNPKAFRLRFVPDSSPLALAGIRIWSCLVLLAYVLVSDLPSTARLPREMLAVSPGRIDLLYRIPGFESLLQNEAALGAFQATAALALVVAAAGLLSRIAVPAAALCALLYVAIYHQYTYFYHQCLIGLYVLTAVSLTPCGDALSVDAWLRRRRGRPPVERPASVYAWSRYFCWTVLALPYFFAGLSKLRNGGWLWWEPLNLRGKVYRDTLQKGVFEPPLGLAFFDAPDWMFGLLGAVTLLLEVGFLLVLFSRLARRWLPAGAVGMHLGILALQNFIFVDAMLMQAIFYDWKRLGTWVRDRLGVPPAIPAGGAERPGYAYGLSEAAFVLTFVWLLRIEAFPLSSWAMYSNRRTETSFVYHVTWAEHATLGRIPAPYEKCFRAPNFNPYIRMASYAFQDPASQQAAHAFFEACGAELNRGKPPGERITAFRVEQWRWDGAERSAEPPLGTLLNASETLIREHP